MIEIIKKNKWFVILAFCLVVILVPIKVSNNISAYAKVVPSKEFIAIKGSNGQIITHLINNLTGIIEQIKTIQVDREDFASFTLKSNASNVLQNDTVAYFSSSHTDYLIQQLKGEILANQSLLKSQLSGAKESLILEQEKIYEISKIQYEEQKAIFERKSALLENKLISKEEYEISKSLFERLIFQMEAEYQKLQTLKTGVKQEEILSTKQKIETLKNELAILETRVSNYNILTPFDGIITGTSSLDTLFSVYTENSLVAVIPIEIEKASRVSIGQNVIINELEYLDSLKINKIDSQIKLINGRNYFICRVAFIPSQKVFSNIFTCSIEMEESTILNILQLKINSMLNFN